MNAIIGKKAKAIVPITKAIISIGGHDISLLTTKKQVALKATTTPTIEMKSAVSPHTNFDGNDTRKSIGMKRDVRIDKNTNAEVEDDKSAIASNKKNNLNQILFKRIGVPVS